MSARACTDLHISPSFTSLSGGMVVDPLGFSSLFGLLISTGNSASCVGITGASSGVEVFGFAFGGDMVCGNFFYMCDIPFNDFSISEKG